MNKRPPFLGYNHNVRHKGRLFHVQTEDSGLTRPVLTTHVFVEGTILSTMRAQYTTEEPDPVVQKRMQDQHKTMLKRVRNGEFDAAHDGIGLKQAGASSGGVKPVAAAPDALEGDRTAKLNVQATAQKPAAATAPNASPVPKKPGPPPPPQPSRKDAAAASGPVPPLSDRSTSDNLRPVDAAPGLSGQSTQELIPVAKTEQSSQALAARLGIAQAATPGIVPPPVGVKAGTGSVVVSGAISSSPAASIDDDVVEMEVAQDDDEPSMTIEAAEPSDDEDVQVEISKVEPLPASVPQARQEETFMMGAAQVVPPPRPTPFSVTVPVGQAARPVRGTRPLTNRPLHSGALRARPTSEGVVVLCLGPVRAKTSIRLRPPNPADPLRITQPHVRPTAPAPSSKFSLPQSSDPNVLDEKLMAFLRREAAR